MRISALIFNALIFLSLPTCVLAQSASVPPQPTSIEGAVTHVYKTIDGIELRLHVFNPPDHRASDQQSAIVFFFGGGWAQGDVQQFVPQSRHLAQRGMVAIVADYRVLRRHNTSPLEAMADAKSAIRWVRSRANELGIDPNRIAAGGGSAGGHLALSAGMLNGFDEATDDMNISSKPNALVLFNPAVDTAQLDRFGASGEKASPLHNIAPNLPPMVIYHGKSDTTVPYTDVEKFCSEVTKFDNNCELHGYQGAGHGFFNSAPWFQETLAEADRFLTSIYYLRPATNSTPVPLPAKRTERFDGALSSAIIAGGARQAANTPILSEIVAPAVVQVDVSIKPEAVHVGKAVSLFVVVEFDEIQYVFTQSGELHVFTGDNLDSFQQIDALSENQEITLFSGRLEQADRGQYKVFVGYQLGVNDNINELIYNTQAIEFVVI